MLVWQLCPLYNVRNDEVNKMVSSATQELTLNLDKRFMFGIFTPVKTENARDFETKGITQSRCNNLDCEEIQQNVY